MHGHTYIKFWKTYDVLDKCCWDAKCTARPLFH